MLTSTTVLRGHATTRLGMEEASRSAGHALGVQVLTPEDDLDRTVTGGASWPPSTAASEPKTLLGFFAIGLVLQGTS